MLVLIGESSEFVFDRGAVARTNAADGSVEQGRLVETAAQDVVNLGGGIDQKTRKLVFNWLCIR